MLGLWVATSETGAAWNGIYPTRDAIVRPDGAVLAEQIDGWAEGRRYLGPVVLARCRPTLTTTDPVNDVSIDALTALTA